jgi:hypothetical protein
VAAGVFNDAGVPAKEQFPGCVPAYGSSDCLVTTYRLLDPILPYWHNFESPGQFQQ